MHQASDQAEFAQDCVEDLAARYPDIPIEAIFKEDLLRRGMAWSREALELSAAYKPKAYFIFSFDMVPITHMDQEENTKAPEEVRLVGGPYRFQPVVVSVRLNPSSPYRVEASDGSLVLSLYGRAIAGVELQKSPEYYRRTLASGKPIMDICPTIEWGYLLYLTTFRLCQYFGAQEECQFCDINENYRQQKKAGRPYTSVKTVEEVLEALEIIASTDSESKAYTVTGGSITSKLDGKSEVEFYVRYPEAIEKRFSGRWISKVVVQALPRDEVRKFRDAGVRIYHPNYEIWDKRLFDIICAGKARFIGREEWIRRILDAADVFGPENVIPNFVAGVEMSKPNGFSSVDDAIASTGEGLDFFMSHGISPRFTTWCPEPLSVLGREQGGAPLEYHVRLLRTYRDTRARHRLPPLPGYGDQGLGRAVFSVSSFMDVLPPVS
ncbi:MAG TPA: radical SAM protein, partial [Acidobacteriota bacterium]|nr:radical SAM protein [Acidobacteriota bacterium]